MRGRGIQKAETVSLSGLKGALVTKDQQLGRRQTKQCSSSHNSCPGQAWLPPVEQLPWAGTASG